MQCKKRKIEKLNIHNIPFDDVKELFIGNGKFAFSISKIQFYF